MAAESILEELLADLAEQRAGWLVQNPPRHNLQLNLHYSIWHFAALEAEVRSMRLSHFLACSPSAIKTESFRIFISTWNVGGYTPTAELNLDDFIPADAHSDIYVLGTCRDCPQDGNSR